MTGHSPDISGSMCYKNFSVSTRTHTDKQTEAFTSKLMLTCTENILNFLEKYDDTYWTFTYV